MAQIVQIHRLIVDILVNATGQSEERLRSDMDRDYIVRSDDAIAYGLIDAVLDSREIAAVAA